MNDAIKGDLVDAMNVLVRRRGNTVDAAEKAVIVSNLTKLQGWLQDLEHTELLASATIVANATDALEEVVASARLGPFDRYLSEIERVMSQLQRRLGQLHASEGLASAGHAGTTSVTSSPASAPSSSEPPAAPAVAPAQAPAARTTPPTAASAAASAASSSAPAKPINSRKFETLAAEYAQWFATCSLRPEYKDNLAYYLKRLRRFREVYTDTGDTLGIPWYFIGIVHAMESGFDFTKHLHNGDSLDRRTVQVPKGRPLTGTPPFTWRESARDALMLKGYHQETDWSLARLLYLLEAYNGFGYRKLGVPTPYLWSFTNHYSRGKFVKDRVFDPNAISKQCGAAAILLALRDAGEVSF